jgi:hypothetical protein
MARIVRPVPGSTASFWLRRGCCQSSWVITLALLTALTLAGCFADGNLAPRAVQSSPPAAAPPAPPDPDGLPAAPNLPPERRAIQIVHGQERIVDVQEAQARGLHIVDLSDGWAPIIFADVTNAAGKLLPNRYRHTFVGLASDRTDADGQPLRPGAKNYLELYGIPPAISVLHARALAESELPCLASIDTSKLLAVDLVTTWGITSERREVARGKARADKLEAMRVQHGAATLEDLATQQPAWAKEVAAHRRFQAERAAFAEAEKRLLCEKLLDPTHHIPGLYDTPMRLAMLDFQQKNVVMAQGDITRSTLEALARSPVENIFLALRRVLTERAAHAAGFLEDGSVQPAPTFLGLDGQKLAVPDLVGGATAAVLARLGISTPTDALAFFRRRRTEDFAWLKVAVRFPEPPPYYSERMDLQAEIDRGDVWYDFPYDEKGERLPQPRTRYPAFTLYVNWRSQRIPLVRWRTTIGGWRSELAGDGQEYLRYKDSDVGRRVWRHVVAAPVWVPPAYSPLTSMVKEKWVNGAIVRVTNYDEVGPGYHSAYGLVAGVHVESRPRPGGGVAYQDWGIRTHGTFDYTSLLGRFSHGCHRLANNLAVRLFSFVLRHRNHRALGPMALDFRRVFWWGGEVFDLRLPTRGFYFELDPPLPVETLKGDLKGKAQKPIAGYVRKPGVQYATAAPPAAPISPEARAGGGAREGSEP